MTDQLLELAFIAAGAPMVPNREMALDAILEIIALRSAVQEQRGEIARLNAALELSEKLTDAFAERYGLLHERYRELADVLGPLIDGPSEHTRLVQ